MSTLVVVRKGNNVCVAADTLSAFQGTEEFAGFLANTDKMIHVGKAWIAFDGPVAVRLAAQQHFAQKGSKRHLYDPLSIFETLGDLAKTLAAEGLELPPSLIASNRGIFRADADRSVVELNRFEALGSGRQYALGAMHAVYDALGSAEAVAMAGLEAASRFDPASELPMTRYSLHVGGGRDHGPQEKPREKSRSKGRNKRRKDAVEEVAEAYSEQPKGYAEEGAEKVAAMAAPAEKAAPAEAPERPEAAKGLDALKSAPYVAPTAPAEKPAIEKPPVTKEAPAPKDDETASHTADEG